MATVAPTAVAERFLEALSERDYEGIAACFGRDARLRALVPTVLRDDEGNTAVAERFRYWLDELSDFAVTECSADELVDRVRLRYRMRGIDPKDGAVMCEQHAYLTVEDGTISAMNLVCSGWLPEL